MILVSMSTLVVAALVAAGVGAAACRALLLRGQLRSMAAAIAAMGRSDASARLVVGRQGRVLYANDEAKRLFGGRPPLQVLAERAHAEDEDAADMIGRLKAAAEIGAAEKVELPLARMGGPQEWWSVSVRPLSVRDGAPPEALLWVAEDVTARRAIDDVLQRERDDLAEFLYLIPVGLFSADADGRLHFVNQRLAEWLGYGADELLDQTLDVIVDREEMPEIEGAWRGEVTFRTRSGQDFRALVLQTTYDDAGETRSRSVVVRDGGTSSQTAGSGEEPRFRWLFDGLPVGLCLLDLEGVVTDCNPAFERMTGLSREEVIDRTVHDFVTAEDRSDLDALMQRVALGAPAGVHREVRLSTSADTAAALAVAPMGTGAGVDALFAVFVDTTVQRNLEVQFAQAQKMQAMGQLAGGVAHDFNNLLTAMIGFCDLLLQRHGAGDPSFSDLMQIKQNANRAANLVRQLLAFSRKQPLRPKLLDVTDALTELSHLLRRLLGEAVQLDLRHGRDVGLVRVDPGQFDQVIINLAVNARDAMEGGGRVIIRTRVENVVQSFSRGADEVPPAEYVVITVSDSGIGIPRENLGRIFEPFFSTKSGPAGSGTGLGLSTVYGIIRQTGGFIFVDSSPGRGTEFTIYLPRQAVAADAQPRAAAPGAVSGQVDDPVEPKADPAADLTGGGVVLLVEDEDPVRVFAARALRNKGYTVLEARTGEGALDLLAEHAHVDLLITDMVMPGMNGVALARRVREDRPGMRVVLISGYSEEAARGELPEAADFYFLPKPFSLNQLAAKVKNVLSGETVEA